MDVYQEKVTNNCVGKCEHKADKNNATNGPSSCKWDMEDNKERNVENDSTIKRLHETNNEGSEPEDEQLSAIINTTAKVEAEEDWEKDLREEHPYTEDLTEMSETARTYEMSRPNDAYCPGDRHAQRIKWRKQFLQQVAGQFDDDVEQL